MYFCAPFGVALVMPTARIMTREEFDAFARPDNAPDPKLYEAKFGERAILGGRPWSSITRRVHMTPAEPDTINVRVRTLQTYNDGTATVRGRNPARPPVAGCDTIRVCEAPKGGHSRVFALGKSYWSKQKYAASLLPGTFS